MSHDFGQICQDTMHDKGLNIGFKSTGELSDYYHPTAVRRCPASTLVYRKTPNVFHGFRVNIIICPSFSFMISYLRNTNALQVFVLYTLCVCACVCVYVLVHVHTFGGLHVCERRASFEWRCVISCGVVLLYAPSFSIISCIRKHIVIFSI